MILLLANQPEKATRVQLFKKTLSKYGEVYVPKFQGKSISEIYKEIPALIKREKPEVLHLFNVPDVLYHRIPKLRGYYEKLIYDYRSPWGVELEVLFPFMRRFGEYFEAKLVREADLITTVNTPLQNKIKEDWARDAFIIPNYPSEYFLSMPDFELPKEDKKIVLFIGRLSKKEGVHTMLRLMKSLDEFAFWVVGDGYKADEVRKADNVRFFGWQPHEKMPSFIRRADLCIAPVKESKLTPYVTDKSVWKINEYLNLGKKAVATGITKEEERKNLILTTEREIEDKILEGIKTPPARIHKKDYRLWEKECEKTVRDVYGI